MTQSTTFAQVATNQFDYLSSALCANTPPYKKHYSSRKFLTSSISLRLLLVMFLTLTVSASAWGADTWEKASSIAAGDVVLLVYESGKMELSGISTTNTKYGIGTAYTSTPAGAYELTVEAGSTSGTYSFKCPNGQYLYWTSGNTLATNATKSANTSWKVTFNQGTPTIVNAKDNSRKLQWNASSPRFACYTTSQTAVQLYKKVISKTLSSISVSGQTTNFTVGDTFTFGGTVTATYSDKSTEDVTSSATFTGYNMSVVGQQTVTVSYEGKSVTYKITVSEPAKHKVYFYNGTNLLNSGGTEFAEGAAVSYSGTTPTSCDGESITFVGWATDTWEGKVAKGNITTNFYDIIDGDELPEMGTSDVNYYAVFAKATTSNGESSTVSLFSENFSSITSGNSTSTSGSSSTWTKNDNFYSVSAAYQAGGAVKLGTGSAIGSIVTKQLTAAVGETLTISFKVKGWSSVEGNIQVSGNNSEFAQPAAITYKSTMSGSFETKTVSVVLTKANPYIKIATTAKRAFIDDIEITKTTSGGETTTYSEYITTCSKETSISLYPNFDSKLPTVTTTGATTYTVPPCTLSRTGYTFSHWDTKADGTGTNYNPGVTISLDGTDVNLYAIWTPIEYQITYEGLGGASNEDNPTIYTIESETITFEEPGDRAGYIFKRWEPETIENGSTGNITVAAQWCEILGDATGLSVQTDYVEDDQTYVKFSWTPADNTKSHATKQVICIGKVGEEKKCTDLEKNQNWSGDLRSKLTPGEYEWTIQAIGNGETYCDGEVISGPNFTIEEELTDNCRWIETEIEEIDPEDEVVVTMTSGTDTWALDHKNSIGDYPKAQNVTIRGDVMLENPADIANLQWNIHKVGTKYTLYPSGESERWLYGVKSYIKVGDGENKAFILYSEGNHECFAYIESSNGYYIGIGTTNSQYAWKNFSSTNHLAKQTLKFYKKTCLPANKFWIDYELANVTCTTDPTPSQIDQTGEDLLLEFSASDGYKLPESISVSIGNNILPEDNDVYIWDSENGELFIPAAQVTDNITITIEGCEQLAAPTGLASSNLTSSSVTLSWNAVQNAESYTVYVTDGTNDITETTSECNVTISGLTKNTLYTWDVIATADAFCENEHSQEWIEFTTLDVFSVIFNNQGKGSAPAPQNVDAGGRATEPTVPTTIGYTFAGWYTEPACTNLFDFNNVITKNTTLYAKWTEWSYTITYAKGSPADEITGEHAPGTKMYTSAVTIAGESFFRSGYKQTGWSKTDGGQKDYNLLGTYGTNEDVTLYPYWTKVHTITWMADGSAHDEVTYLDGETLALPETDPEACQGSEFVGWTDDPKYSHPTDAPDFVAAGGEVNADATYYAVYAEEPEGELVEEVEKTYTFSKYTAGTQYAENEVHKLDDDVTITTTKCHFTSELRVYDSSTNDGIVISNALPGRICSMSFNLGYKAATLHVYGSINGENWTLVNSISSESSYSDKKMDFGSTTNYTYFKLDADGDQVRIKTMTITYMSGSGEPSAAHKNYSTTCIPTYYVNYDFAGGENGCENGSVTAGGNYTICNVEPTKTGYSFQGWNDGTITHAAGATIDNVQSNITLTAVWEANTYTITWMSNGEEYTTTTHTYDQTLEILSEPYTCYGTKTFMGWTETSSVNENGEGIVYVDENTNPSENKTYCAVFADEVIGEPKEVEATLSFADKAQRTSFSSTQQVWEQNGIILTNNKASAQSNVGDYANPARFYAASSIDIQAPGNITKIVFACSESKYANALIMSIGTAATYLNTTVTATLDGKSKTFTIVSLSAQVQMSSLTITYQSTPETAYSNYTTTPSGCPEIEVAENAYVTSTSGQSVKVKVPVTISNYQEGISLSASIEGESNFTIANISSITEGTATLEIAYKPTDNNTTENTTVTVLTKIGENKVTATDFTITGRSLPETFAIVAKVGNVWYALPSQGLNSTTPPTAYPVEVDDMADPTAVTAVPANADWSLRQVYTSSGSDDRFADYGDNLVFVNNASPAMALNASTSGNYLLTDAQYANYYQTNPGLYEWTPTTTDLETYTLTNAQRTDRTLNVATNTVFGVHSDNKATTEVRFLPIQNRYTPAALQVVKWKENSVVIMYNGDPAQMASVSVNGAAVQNTTLSAAQRDLAVYELAATGLADNPSQRLSITIGTETTILSIPYIISGSKNDIDVLPGSTVAARQEVAKVSDLVILKGATLTAEGAKGNPYKCRNVTVYGGGKLVVPADNGFGVNSLTLRIGGVTADGSYDYVYPEFVLDGTWTNTSGKINLDYVTTKEQYYTFAAPFAVQTKDIHYPVDIYGNNVAANNRGSFEFQYYDGAARAAGERGWKVVEEDLTNGATLTAHKGYTFYGMPKKVSVNGGTSTRQKFGIHRIPMTVTAANAMSHENSEQTIAVAPHPSEKNINSGWNLIGNPYMSTITGLDNQSIVTGSIVLVDNRWEWSNDETYNQRFIVFPSNDGEWYYTYQASHATLPAFKNFFVQIDNEANALSIPYTHRASGASAPARRLAEDMDKDIELAIVLEQDDKYADQMDFLLNDAYSAVYDRNADFTKMMNNTNFNLFGVHMDDYLSFVAIDTYTARSSVAIGYQVPQAGQYTLRLSDKPYVMWSLVDAIYVTDHEVTPEVTTNLLDEAYTFQVTNAETNTTRFSISIVPSKESGGTSTAIDDILHQDMQTQKIIYNDQLYILRGGVVYDAMGQRVTSINK